MTTVRGKLVTLGGQQRFFPAVSPLGALDSARDRGHARDDHEDDDHGDHDAHDVALAHVHKCSDEQAEELQAALDRRAGARDRRARDRLPDNDDHTRDFDPSQPTSRERVEAYERARDGHGAVRTAGRDRGADSRRGMAQDRAAPLTADGRPLVALDTLFPQA